MGILYLAFGDESGNCLEAVNAKPNLAGPRPCLRSAWKLLLLDEGHERASTLDAGTQRHEHDFEIQGMTRVVIAHRLLTTSPADAMKSMCSIVAESSTQEPSLGVTSAGKWIVQIN